MNSRQRRRVAQAKKLGIQVQKPTRAKPQPAIGDNPPPSQELGGKLSIRVLSALWKWLIAVLTVLGGITAINALRYDVSIDSYASLNLKEPLETRFVLANQGPFAIYKVHYTCEFPNMNIPGLVSDISLRGAEIVDFEEAEMEARGKISLRCENPVTPIDGSILRIRVSYRPSFWLGTVEGGNSFMLKRDSEGNAVWLPIGRLK